jgi:hypothetical protein
LTTYCKRSIPRHINRHRKRRWRIKFAPKQSSKTHAYQTRRKNLVQTLNNQILNRLSAAPLAEDQLIRDLKNLPPISHRPSLNWSFLAVWSVTPAGF